MIAGVGEHLIKDADSGKGKDAKSGTGPLKLKKPFLFRPAASLEA
jgi:hypothetical protein